VLCSCPESSSRTDKKSGYTIFRAGSLSTIFATSIAPSFITKLISLKGDYDVLHVHFPNPMAALALYFIRPSNKIVVHWHSDIIRQRKIYTLFRPLEKWVLKRADKIIGTSEKYIYGSKALRNFLHKTTVVPLGISTDRFADNPVKDHALKTRFGTKKIVFSLGRLVYYKGFEQLVEAAKYLDDNTVVLIGGDGELRKKLEALIVQSRLENKVKLLGRIPDDEIASYYQACDVFCLPSTQRSEAFGVVQLEAMYFGKPIIATEIPGSGVSWVNQHNITGLNVPANNAYALSQAINNVLGNPQLATTFGINAKKRFHDVFTRTEMVHSIAEIYKRLLAPEEVHLVPKNLPDPIMATGKKIV
jgi:rhamnosyl/mannosyltransferase